MSGIDTSEAQGSGRLGGSAPLAGDFPESSSEPTETSIEMDVSDLGLDPGHFETDEVEFEVTPRPLLLRNTLLLRARAWVGKEFLSGCPEQCANWVRRLLAETGVWVPASPQPFDIHLTEGMEQGAAFANSFFSPDNGRLLGYADLQPGDLMAFRDTYGAEFPSGCITHVGVYMGDHVMIDRPTAGAPVRQLPLDAWWKEHFAVGLRPFELC